MERSLTTEPRGLFIPEYGDRPPQGHVRVAIVGLGHIGPLGRYGTLPDGIKVTEAWDNIINGVNGIRPIPHELFPEYSKYNNIETKVLGYVDHDNNSLDEMLEDMGSVSDLEFKSRSTKLAEIATKLCLHNVRGNRNLMEPYSFNRGIREFTSYRIIPELADDIAVLGGTGMGGASDSIVRAQRELETRAREARVGETGEKIDPVWVFRALPGASEESATMDNQAHGESFGNLAECATGGETAGNGARLIKDGTAIGVLLVNTESTIEEPIGVALFDGLGALTKGSAETSPHASCEEDDGFGFGEGATAVMFMDEEEARRRGYHVYAVVSGFAGTSDGYHPSFPREDGRYQKMAIERALHKSGGPPKVGGLYIREHATGTKPLVGPSADVIEAVATRDAIDEILERYNDPRTFEQVVLGTASLKPLTGHLLGADGLTGVMYAALAIENGTMPGNWKTETLLAPARRLNMIVNETRYGEVTKAQVNSFGFGGHNTSVVLDHKNLNPTFKES